jgi:hypothetical protein
MLLKSANDYGAVDHFGLNLPDLVPAAWELVPWSWVVDYFTTVGAYLDDVFSSDPSACRYVCQNRLYRVEVNTDVWWARDNGVKYPDQSEGRSYVELFEFDRTMLSNLPSRSLRFKTLDEIGLNGVNKLLNLVAVLGQR